MLEQITDRARCILKLYGVLYIEQIEEFLANEHNMSWKSARRISRLWCSKVGVELVRRNLDD